MITKPLEADLHAFVDGQLDDLGARRFASAINAQPALRVVADSYRRDRDQLRLIYGPLIEEPLPARLLRPLTAVSAPRHPAAWQWSVGGGLAAAAVLLVVWLGVKTEPRDALLAEAFAVRDGAVAAEQQIAANMPADERDAMVAKTLDASINIPDLDQEGYVLAGLGVYPDQAHGHAIQVNYRNGDGRLLTVYLRHPTGADRYEILPERNGKRVCVWESQELSAVMVGEMSEQEMLRTAYLAYHALNF
ncbi:MAG: hypothetical protein QOJ54_995 [Aliidongia sp.]|nr:hypothetical protein [Aliidongia sp.]